MSLSIPSEVSDAIAKVRSDKSSDKADFCVATYDTDKSLKLVEVADTGVVGLAAALATVDDICYALLRVNFLYEKTGVVKTTNTKFMYVVMRPDNLPIKRKMKIGVYEGAVKKCFMPYHLDFEVSIAGEVTEEIVQSLISNVTSRADHQTDKRHSGSYHVAGKRMSHKTDKKSAAKAKMSYDIGKDTSKAPSKGAAIKLADEEGLKATIASVRADKDATNWCVFGYEGKDKIVEVAKGESEDVSDLLAAFGAGQVCYGLLRVTEKIDKTVAVKFVFIVWMPDDVHPMTKARSSTHKGAVAPLFRPYNVDFQISEKADLTKTMIMDKIGGLSGQRSHVTERRQSRRVEKFERKFLGGVSGETQSLTVGNEDALKEAIQAVRSDSNDVNWALAAFEGSSKKLSLEVIGVGSGGVDELKEQLKSDKVMYAIVRVAQTIDKSETVKFLFIHFQGSKISTGVKGNTGVLKGAVTSRFSPFHTDLFLESASDISASTVKKMFKDSKASY